MAPGLRAAMYIFPRKWQRRQKVSAGFQRQPCLLAYLRRRVTPSIFICVTVNCFNSFVPLPPVFEQEKESRISDSSRDEYYGAESFWCNWPSQTQGKHACGHTATSALVTATSALVTALVTATSALVTGHAERVEIRPAFN